MKKIYLYDGRFVTGIMALLVFTFGLVIPWIPIRHVAAFEAPTTSEAQKPSTENNIRVAEEKDPSPSLRGIDAVNRLKESGQYESLRDAFISAQTKHGLNEVESPTMDAFGLRAQLTASDGGYFDFFGEAVAMSGSTAVVGACLHTENGNFAQGAAYVFVRSGNAWFEQQELTASDGAAGDQFGIRVAIDGQRVIVGARRAKIGPAHGQGAAYVFVRTGTAWNEETKLTAADGNAGFEFGQTVGISGVTAVVGSARGGGQNGVAGSVYVFVKGTTWTQQQKLLVEDGGEIDDFSETGLVISGETIIVGDRWAPTAMGEGAAYVFTRSGSIWTQQQKLTDPEGSGGGIRL